MDFNIKNKVTRVRQKQAQSALMDDADSMPREQRDIMAAVDWILNSKTKPKRHYIVHSEES